MSPFTERPTWLRALWGVFVVLCGTGRECLASPSYTITDLGAVPAAAATTPWSYAPVLGVNSAGQGYVRAADGSAAYAFQRSSVDHANVPNVNAYVPPMWPANNQGSPLMSNLTINSQGWGLGEGAPSGSLPGWSAIYSPQGGWNSIAYGDNSHWPGLLADINASNTVAGSIVRLYFLQDGQKVYTTDPILAGVTYQNEYRAALLDPTSNKWLDLNTQLPAGSGWFLTQALKIDDLGQIVGVGTLNGAEHEFLMTPGGPPTEVSTPEPGPLALASLVALGLVLKRRRGRSA
ncbi:MAG: hypothetical protein ACP5XB_20180 [Isosphaeraceae bacterium]